MINHQNRECINCKFFEPNEFQYLCAHPKAFDLIKEQDQLMRCAAVNRNGGKCNGSWFEEDKRSCTCHPDDNPPIPCVKKFALSDCMKQKGRHMKFGDALDALVNGSRVTRKGWNGKGMWLTYSPGHVDLPAEKFFSENNRKFAEENGGKATVCPSIMIKNANNTISYWQPSSGDMFGEDWEILED